MVFGSRLLSDSNLTLRWRAGKKMQDIIPIHHAELARHNALELVAARVRSLNTLLLTNCTFKLLLCNHTACLHFCRTALLYSCPTSCSTQTMTACLWKPGAACWMWAIVLRYPWLGSSW